VFDTYDQEFPDVQEYDPGTTKDYNEEPKIEDALDTLIKDEYEAIDGYEVADETIQHASIPEDEKDDILDTLEHIKEEEEEHIDELKELTGEEDSEDESEEKSEEEDSEDDEDDEDDGEREKLEEAVQLTEGLGGFLDKYCKSGYKLWSLTNAAEVKPEHKNRVIVGYKKAYAALKTLSKHYAKTEWAMSVAKISDLTDPEILAIFKKYNYCLAFFKAGAEVDKKSKAIRKDIKNLIATNKKFKKLANLFADPEEDRAVDVAAELEADTEKKPAPAPVDVAAELETEAEDKSAPAKVDPTSDEDSATKEPATEVTPEKSVADTGLDALLKAGVELSDEQKAKFRAIFGESLKTTDAAVAELKDTEKTLKSAAKGIQNMTKAITEEYHKYANPAELKAMEDVEELVSTALSNIYGELTAWGYETEEVDSQSFMSQENESCMQYMVNFKDLDKDEIEDLADQLQTQLENELSAYKPVSEIEGIAGDVVLPDYDLAEEEDEDEGITRASIVVYVTFARNLF
jgi:rubrerythrin